VEDALRLVMRGTLDQMPTIEQLGDFFRIYAKASMKNAADVATDLGLSESRIKNIKSGGIKHVAVNDVKQFIKFLEKIRDPALIRFLASNMYDLVKVDDTFHNIEIFNDKIGHVLYNWSGIENQNDTAISKMMSKCYFRRFVITVRHGNDNYFNSLMYVKRSSSDNKLFSFRTFRPIDIKRWEIVNGFFFDIDGLLFSFGKYQGGRGLRATQMNYSFESEGFELKGLRLSSINNRPFSYRLYGIEIPRHIKASAARNILGVKSQEEMIGLYPELYKNNRAFDYLSIGEIFDNGIMGGEAQVGIR
jgi:hypothetical protein